MANKGRQPITIKDEKKVVLCAICEQLASFDPSTKIYAPGCNKSHIVKSLFLGIDKPRIVQLRWKD